MKRATLRGLVFLAVGSAAAVAWGLLAFLGNPPGSPGILGSSHGSGSAAGEDRRDAADHQRPPLTAPRTDAQTSAENRPVDLAEHASSPSTQAPAFSIEDDQQWMRSFDDASLEEILAARQALLDEIGEKANPVMRRMHEQGRSTFLGPELQFGGDHGGGSIDNLDIAAVYMEPGAGTFTVHLPPEQYPDLYALKARAVWLSALAHDRRYHHSQ